MTSHAFPNVIHFTGRILRTIDKRGRWLVVQSLTATQRQRLKEIFGENWDNPLLAFPAEIISSVRNINGKIYDFPSTRAEFDELSQAVELEGIEAVALTFERVGIHVDERVKKFLHWNPCVTFARYRREGGDVA